MIFITSVCAVSPSSLIPIRTKQGKLHKPHLGERPLTHSLSGNAHITGILLFPSFVLGFVHCRFLFKDCMVQAFCWDIFCLFKGKKSVHIK